MLRFAQICFFYINIFRKEISHFKNNCPDPYLSKKICFSFEGQDSKMSFYKIELHTSPTKCYVFLRTVVMIPTVSSEQKALRSSLTIAHAPAHAPRSSPPVFAKLRSNAPTTFLRSRDCSHLRFSLTIAHVPRSSCPFFAKLRSFQYTYNIPSV